MRYIETTFGFNAFKNDQLVAIIIKTDEDKYHVRIPANDDHDLDDIPNLDEAKAYVEKHV